LGSYHGLTGVALAVPLNSYLSFIGAWISMRLAKISFVSYLKVLLPAFSGSLLMFMIVTPLNIYVFSQVNFTHLLSLSLSILAGVCTYGSYIFLFYRKDVFELINFVKGGAKQH
ncbi:hypothetical protein KA005_05650, partial [bacterium]|nr:hypothetical protein [bacterium]